MSKLKKRSAIGEYLALIGSKGGKASKGKPTAKERAKKAAAARWKDKL
jgi:hypothetical protein